MSNELEGIETEVDSLGVHSLQLNQNQFPRSHAQLERLRCIEIIAAWEGGIRTNQLTHSFGISRKSATCDIALYRENNPGALEFDSRLKMFVVTPDFVPIYSQASENDFLLQLSRSHTLSDVIEDLVLETPGLDVIPVPAPRTSKAKFRTILQAIRRSRQIHCSVIIDKAGEYLEHRDGNIVPTKLVRSHLGWYVRYYDLDTDQYDMVKLNRIRNESMPPGYAPKLPGDESWYRTAQVICEPRQDLPPGEIALTEADWDISKTCPLTISVREPFAPLILHYWKAIDQRLSFQIKNGDISFR